MLRRLLTYSEKIFNIQTLFENVNDSRPQGKIPTKIILFGTLMIFLNRLRSLNELEQHKDNPSWKKWLKHKLPSADEFGYITERVNIEELRDVSKDIYSCLKRNKVLIPFHGWDVSAIDGHEINCSYDRCCDECLQRKIEVNGEKRIQYYHRIVVIQILGEKTNFPLDGELVKPGEDEIAAAMRLLKRVLKRYPRAFNILTGDALYTRAEIFKLMSQHGKYALIVLKNETRDLIKDVRRLCEEIDPIEIKLGNKTSLQWDIENLRTWEQVEEPVRVVRSLETQYKRKRTGKKWIQNVKEHDWLWVSNMPQSILTTEKFVEFGHARWKIENEGFNELANEWNADHYFHHHPISILVFWLVMFIAHAIFHCFFLRNIKPQLKQNHTVIFFAFQIAAEFRQKYWWAMAP